MFSNPWPSLTYRDFRLFWIGAFITRTGTWVHNAAVPYTLYQLTHEEVWVGAAGFAFMIPAMLTSIPGGHLADHHDRRRVLVILQLVSVAISGFMTLLWMSGEATPWAILILTSVISALIGLSMPAMQTVSTEVLPEKHVQNGIFTNVVANQAGRALGPLIAGVVLAVWDPGIAFLIDTITYIAGALLVFAMHSNARPEHETDARPQAFSDILRTSGVALAIALSGLIAFLGPPIVQLSTLLAEQSFRVDAQGYGRLLGAYGVGALIGALSLTLLAHRFRRSTAVTAGTFLFGAALIALGTMHIFVIGVLCMLLAGACFSVTLGSLNAAMQKLSMISSRGRVVSLYLIAINAGAGFGALAGGWASEHASAASVVAIGGFSMIATGIVSAMRAKRFDVNEFPTAIDVREDTVQSLKTQ